MAEALIRYPIVRNITLTAGQIGEITLDFDTTGKYYIDSIGYTWFSSTTFIFKDARKLIWQGQSQIGTLQQPFFFDNLPIEGAQFKISVKNETSTTNTYKFLIIIKSDRVLSHLAQDSSTLEPTVDSGTEIIKTGDVSTGYENKKATATTTEGSTSYTAIRRSHIIINDGAADCFINFDAVATTSSFELKAGETLSIELNFTTLHYITATGTANLRWLGVS